MLKTTFLRSQWVLCLILVGAGLSSPVPAQDQPPPRDHDGAREQRDPRQRGQEGSMADSVRRIGRESRGVRVLSAEPMQSGDRSLNRIKAMDDRGRVRVYVDDPQRRQRSDPRPPRRGDD